MPETRLNRPKRQLSRFMCEELLYEYAKEKLDKDRKHAVEEGLNSNDDLRRDLESMRLAMSYCEQVASSKISTLEMEKLRSTPSPVSDAVDRLRYRNWPDVVQWTVQALVLSSLVAVFALMMPWQKIENRLSYLVASSGETRVHVPQQTPVATPAATLAVSKATTKVAAISTPPAKTSPVASTPAPTTTATTAMPALPANVEFVDETTGAPANLKGILYRMLMALPDVDSIAPQVRSKILSLGGFKAGQVELGWRKVNPSGAYFHFIIPEQNFNTLIKTLGGYGPVRILKTAHQRVMPKGKIRIILWIKEQTPDSQTNDQNDNTDQ